MTVRAKIEETSSQEGPQLPESDRRELGAAVGTDRRDIVFFDKLYHFHLLILYTVLLL